MKRFCILLIVFLSVILTLNAQTKPRLAILPFTGTNREDGEAIARFFSYEQEINRNFTPVPRTSTIDNIMREQQFQRSGLTDADTISELGKMAQADYVLAGHITELDQSKLLLITIIHVEQLRQIAGDYREYRNIEETENFLPDMARRIASASKLNVSQLPRLAVLPFNVQSKGVDQNDAEVLAQILAIDITNSGKYAVFPRTKTIETVMAEHNIQRSGLTDPANIRRIGVALNAQYLLDANFDSLGTNKYFSAAILRIESGEQELGTRKQYRRLADGLSLMTDLAEELTGVRIERPIPTGLVFESVNGKSVTITGYKGNSSMLRIPDKIHGLPVTVIGLSAFEGTFGLLNVTIPSTVTTIDDRAFMRCYDLTSINIPSSVTTIGHYAFFSCYNLTSITIPSSVKSIGLAAFSACKDLASITVDNQNSAYSSVDGVLFDKNKETLIQYPVGKKTENYTIPYSVKKIEPSAFQLNSLQSITIPSSVTDIGSLAFFNSRNLTNITIPYSVTYIGYGILGNCEKLTNITVNNQNPYYTSVGGVLFDKSLETIVQYPAGKKDEMYVIPSSVDFISGYAFYGCFNLVTITLPSSVLSIYLRAFGSCYKLTNIIIPSSVTFIGEDAFKYCPELKNVTISRHTRLGNNAFDTQIQINYRD